MSFYSPQKEHLDRPYDGPAPVLSTLHTGVHLVLTRAADIGYCYAHLPNEELEVSG